MLWYQFNVSSAAEKLFMICALDSGPRSEESFSECVFVVSGPLAVPDAAAQGHGDPGWGADAEGAAGHRWWHPGCPGAHICWRPRALSSYPMDKKAFHRGGRGLSCCQGMINDGCRHTIYIVFLTYVPHLQTVRFNWAVMTAFFLWMLLDLNFKINVIMLTSSTPEPLSMLFHRRLIYDFIYVFNFAETLARSP